MISTAEIDARITEAHDKLEGAIEASSPVGAREWAEVLHNLLLIRRIVDEDHVPDEG